ncbi:hypothetical protein [Priestia megaterium]|uniref:hypothetical protein n=1 Tax=Priestia megaterium TaxID=1404 RepID=UPI0031016E87
MNYILSFLIKVIISIALLIATFNIWKMESKEVGILTWVLPLVAIFWIILTIVDAIQIQRGKKWLKDKEEDEREIIVNYRVGYITFWCNMGLLAFFFFFYGMYYYGTLSPIVALVLIAFLNVVIYFGLKLYILFFR